MVCKTDDKFSKEVADCFDYVMHEFLDRCRATGMYDKVHIKGIEVTVAPNTAKAANVEMEITT